MKRTTTLRNSQAWDRDEYDARVEGLATIGSPPGGMESRRYLHFPLTSLRSRNAGRTHHGSRHGLARRAGARGGDPGARDRLRQSSTSLSPRGSVLTKAVSFPTLGSIAPGRSRN